VAACAAVVEFLVGPLLEAPEKVGKPLRYELEGYSSARRGAYRIVYRVDHNAHTVRVRELNIVQTCIGRARPTGRTSVVSFGRHTMAATVTS
jgi:hypothetical protein